LKALRLQSRRGQLVDEGQCSHCGREALELWRYAKSNQGEVTLCLSCKNVALDRSFGRLDMLDFSLRGAFESKRRRH
jgi:hypothetical protein